MALGAQVGDVIGSHQAGNALIAVGVAVGLAGRLR